MKKSELRQIMQERRTDEIEPSAAVKDRLDKALRIKRNQVGFHIPMYQSMAAAVLFLLAGVGIGQLFEKPQQVVQRMVQVVKYVDRPIKEIQYIKVPASPAPILTSKAEAVAKDSVPVKTAYSSGENDLAVADINRVQSGISMGDDTVLQKMMVTIY